MSDPIRILLADDHALVRGTLADYLRGVEGVTVLGVVSDAGLALEEAKRLQPDVIVMDIDMPGMVCFDAVRAMKTVCPAARVVFLCAFATDRYIGQALAVEASGYVTKSEPPESLLHAIRSAVAGTPYFSPEVLSRLVVTPQGATLAEERQSRSSTLTPREIEVLRYLTRGLAKKEIAALLHISLNTVNRHSDSLMAKLDIHDRVQLARFAIREGLAEA